MGCRVQRGADSRGLLSLLVASAPPPLRAPPLSPLSSLLSFPSLLDTQRTVENKSRMKPSQRRMSFRSRPCFLLNKQYIDLPARCTARVGPSQVVSSSLLTCFVLALLSGLSFSLTCPLFLPLFLPFASQQRCLEEGKKTHSAMQGKRENTKKHRKKGEEREATTMRIRVTIGLL